MEKYIITEDYYDEYADILGDDFPVDTIVTQDEDGTLHLVGDDGEESKGAHTNDGGPITGPPKPPPIPPGQHS